MHGCSHTLLLKFMASTKYLSFAICQLADAVISQALLSTEDFSEVEIHKQVGVTVWMSENAFSASSYQKFSSNSNGTETSFSKFVPKTADMRSE